MVLLPDIGLGCAALAIETPQTGDDEVVELLVRAHAYGIRYFDVAPLYGGGRGEVLLGRALTRMAPGVIVSTKVGYAGDIPYGGRQPPSERRKDFSRGAIEQGLEASLRRLGRDMVDIVFLHDPPGGEETTTRDALATLRRLSDQGLIRCIGIGTTNVATAASIVECLPNGVLLLAGRYTLVDRTGEAVIGSCSAAGVQLVAGGIFNSGLLAAVRPGEGATFDYAPARAPMVARAEAALRVCAARGIPMKAAALQFARRNPSVATTLLGPRTRDELDELLRLLALPVPPPVWDALDADAVRGTQP